MLLSNAVACRLQIIQHSSTITATQKQSLQQYARQMMLRELRCDHASAVAAAAATASNHGSDNDQNGAYRINGAAATLLGDGDHHDPPNSTNTNGRSSLLPSRPFPSSSVAF